MLYCVASSTPYNLAFFIAKRMEFVRRQPRKDYGTKRSRHSNSSSSSFDHPSSSHHVDDDNNDADEGTSRVSTHSPSTYVNSLSDDVSQVFTNPPHGEQTMETLFT
ncbi:hypothetical protein Tco_1116979 [Tanacetum coccineum]